MKTLILTVTGVLLLTGVASSQETPQAAAARRAAVLEQAQQTLREGDAYLAKAERILAEAYRTLFTREGATPLDFDRDKWACDRDLGLTETRGSAARRPLGGRLYLHDLETCLALTGWQRAQR